MIDNVLASRFGMLTALRIVPSSNAARTDCAISMPTLSCASAVDAPRCGVRTRFGAERKRRIVRQRFLLENIERRGGNMSILQRAWPSDLVDQSATRAIDDADAAFHFLQPRKIDNVTCLGGERRVQRNEIRSGEQIVELIEELDLQTARARGGEIRIVSDHAHAEGDGAPAQLAADPAHADDAERFVVELDAFETLSGPSFSRARSRPLAEFFARRKAKAKMHARRSKRYFRRAR